MASGEKSKAMTIVKIEWLDTLGVVGWHTCEEVEELKCPHITSVGFLVSEDNEAVKLTGMDAPDSTKNVVQLIPKGCVISRKELKEA